MRVKKASDDSVTLWISRRETRDWADRPTRKWPCSTVAGRAVRVRFDASGDIIEAVVSGRGVRYVDQEELEYLVLDFYGGKHVSENPR